MGRILRIGPDISVAYSVTGSILRQQYGESRWPGVRAVERDTEHLATVSNKGDYGVELELSHFTN